MSAREIITEVLEWEFGEAADDQADEWMREGKEKENAAHTEACL